MSNWLDEMHELSGRVYHQLGDIADGYKGLHDRDGRHGFAAHFEARRKGIGKGHGWRNDAIVRPTKEIMFNLQRDHDLVEAQVALCGLQDRLGDIDQIDQPSEQGDARRKEAYQEWVECYYFVLLYPVVFMDHDLPQFKSAEELQVEPRVFLKGLIDVVTELGKAAGTHFLRMSNDQFTLSEVTHIRARLAGVALGILDFLDEFELTYGLVVNLSFRFMESLKMELVRKRDFLERLKADLVNARLAEQAMAQQQALLTRLDALLAK
jgi:hypothetical protein